MCVNNLGRKFFIFFLFAISIILQGCGGGDDKGETKKTNQTIIPVTFSGDNSVIESKEFSITATANGATSFAWTISDNNIVLSGADSNTASFTAPAIDQDTAVTLTLNVTGNNATGSGTFDITMNRKVSTLTISGLVTDKPIANATVTFEAGTDSQQTTTDSEGYYDITLEIDESNVDKLLKITAVGDATNGAVEFVSLLPTIATLVAAAGEDGTLDIEDEFGVNITNVSTAEFTLLEKANGGEAITSEEQLAVLAIEINPQEKLELAAVIKLIVDDPDYDLPEGFESTLDLVADEQATEDFVTEIGSQDPNALDNVLEEIKQDEKLTGKVTALMVGEYLITNPQYYFSSSLHVSLLADNVAKVSQNNGAGEGTWQATDTGVSISLTKPIKSEDRSYCTDEDSGIQFECQETITHLDIELIAMNDVHYDVSYLYTGVQKDINNQYQDREIDFYEPSTASLISLNNTLMLTEAELLGSFTIDNFINSEHSEPALVTFSEGAVGTVVIAEDVYSLTWEIKGTQLTVRVPDYDHTTTDVHDVETLHEGLTNQYWFIKQSDVLSQTVSLSSTGKSSSALFVENKPGLAFTEDNAVGGWLFHYNSIIYRYDLYEDGSFIPDWNWEGRPYIWSITDDGQMFRERERCDIINDGTEVCYTYQKVYHKKLAEDGDFFYVARDFQQYWVNYDTGVVEFYKSFKGIFVFEKSEHYGHTRFYEWTEGRSFYSLSAEDPKAPIHKLEFTNPGEGSWNYNEVPKDDNGYFVIDNKNNGTDVQFTPYHFASGTIVFNSFDDDKEMRLSIIDHERNFYTVCHYETGTSAQEIQDCSTGELLYVFDEASKAEAMQGQSVINQQKFVGKTVYNFELSDGSDADIIVMEMADNGTVTLTAQDGTSSSGTYTFNDNQVISFNVSAEGEYRDTFAVITGYDSADNIYEYCYVDDNNITAASAKQACLADDVSGTSIDKLYYGEFIFDKALAQSIIARLPLVGEYLLADMFISLNADGGHVQLNASSTIDIDWSLNDDQIVIMPSEVGRLFNETSTCINNESGNSYDCAAKLAKITIDIVSENQSNYVVDYQIELIDFDISNTYPDKTVGLAEVIPSVTMFDTDSTLPMLTENMTGQWYIESFLPNENTALVTFNADGSGSTIVTGEEYGFTWTISGVRLHINVPNYTYLNYPDNDNLTGYSNTFWLTDDSHSLYRNITMSGINGISQARIFDTPTVTDFTFDEAATGWNIELSQKQTTVYDFHQDGEYFYGWGYSSYNEWRIDNGEILRYHTLCEVSFNGCVEYAQIIHRKIAVEGDVIYALRQWQFLNEELYANTGEIQYQLNSSHILTMDRKETYGESNFSSNFDNSYSYVVKGTDNDLVNESWVFSSANGWSRDDYGLPDDKLNYIIRDTGGTPTNVAYEYADGQIAYTENGINYRISILETARYYIKVCIAEQSVLTNDCVNGETMYFYRNSERAEQHTQFNTPSPEARFLAEMVYDKSFNVTMPNDVVSAFTFNADGTGFIQYPPSADNNFDAHDTNTITWQVSRTGTLTFTEARDNGNSWLWTILASDTSTNSTSFTWYSSGQQDSGLQGLETGTGTMTRQP
ncbi:carboxypeptidase-like regulatory domain-containing protein [Colwellia psychrerythraea]|uniref:PKD domain-containing protein n=1 Tax=Colwellia psychrerythraea TaxID=28229 RepID=A0A099L3X7_COLPS|nr:carboxypeptidase-like regulatory domain-containing protein [Colwellia psychrerythraea]KGJ97644.1 hypothetical protein GAB14E_1233 [Colwellia psychrerythraea]